MSETIGDAAPAKGKPTTIQVPPRGLLFESGPGHGLSPGPLTLISSLFPEQGSFSFSQLLAGAMASPPAEGPTRLFVGPPGGLLNSPGYLSPLQSPFGMSHQQALAHVTAQAALSQSFKQMQAEFHHSSPKESTKPLTITIHSSDTLKQQTNPLPSDPESSKLESSEISQPDKKTAHVANDKPDSDGYNWRKYGQKHVKGSECPRSYYKCTHQNCSVKKKVERASDGRVSDITYKGEHNHDPPKANKRGKDISASDTTKIASQGQSETDSLKETLPVLSESANFQTTTERLSEHRPLYSHANDDMKDALIVVDEADDDEPNAKRRSLDIGQSTPASSHQTVSDSKIVLETRSEVDLLDDGYKWRKYGQKVVKGNPYPRSYYRCTYAGCNVRKHVDRAPADPKTVITTYEGKHNHEILVGPSSDHAQANASARQLKREKKVSKNSSLNKEVDHVPITLQLKDEQIAA